jgi:hypothetical protein
MQILFAGVILIVAFPVAVQILLAVLSNPLLAVFVVPAGIYAMAR